ncbi:hypothetical protein Fmac_004354 [Flemingia macrophylla]|uniref:Uncharacterized protein n=1 Tax=Flemingia macrophylla TaxID=520843 RepID=A0ABD1N4P3_9FABA
MLISLETLAMAGASNVQFPMDIEEWERKDSELNPPPHLLAEEYYNEEYFVTFRINHQEKLDRTEERRKPKCTRKMLSLFQKDWFKIYTNLALGTSCPAQGP